MALTIDTRFAIDRNHNKKVDDGEVVTLEQLAEKDRDENKAIEGKEFEDVYFEYGQDRWIPADREFREKGEGYTTVVKMNRVDLKTGAVDVSISITA